jgi:hypothetical protein
MRSIPELDSLYDLILEKDHRQKIVKFGVPQDVADYLHQLDDKYSLWFADKLMKMEDFQKANNKINWIRTHILTDMQGILDWVKNVQDTILKNYTWEQAVAAQREYHQNIETKTLNNAEKNKIIKQYDDGYYWVDLESTNCSEEAESMGHCARTSAETLFSLRRYTPESDSIESFITIGASPSEGTWTQAKGKRNSKPKEMYYGYIADILVDNEMLRYKTEYDSKNDFTAVELKQYVEDHPDQFVNSDELITKISESVISFKDFKQIYNNLEIAKLKYYSIDLSDDSFGDNEEYVQHRASIYWKVPLENFGDYAYNVEEYITKDNPYDGEDSKKSRDILHDVFPNESFNFVRVNIYENEINFLGDIESRDDISEETESGLDNFRDFCNNIIWEDEHFDEEKTYERFLEYLRDKNVIPDEDEDSSVIKPKRPEDPRQMKFDFMNAKENCFYKLYSQIIKEGI